MRTVFLTSLPLVLLTAVASTAEAMPPGPGVLCEAYPASTWCLGDAEPECKVCHSAAPNLNSYGTALKAELLPGESRPLSEAQYISGLPTALAAIEDDDTDGDTYSNYDEIIEGTFPGDSNSKPDGVECPENDDYDLCAYDYAFAMRRVSLDVCGVSPSFDEMEALRAMSSDEDKRAAIAAKLSSCLDSSFWQGPSGVLANLANRKIRPVGTLKAGDGPGSVAIADYDHDYDLFVWSQLDDHDARDVLTAQYFVDREPDDSLRILTEQEVLERFVGAASENNVPVEQRAGLLTTAWSLLYFEMFSIIPRALAAQASRAFLREDWARMEGLSHIDGLQDYDNAGITEAACYTCHGTIEGNSFAFQNLAGFVGTGGQGRASFVPNRMAIFEGAFPGISNMPSGFFKGQPVADHREWGQRAADSDAFARATVLDYWDILVSAEPTGTMEIDEFTTLWQDLRGVDNYSVEAMLRKLVFTRSYGEP